MKLAKSAPKTTQYSLDVGNGHIVQSEMPSSVAEEIAKRAESVQLDSKTGEYVVNDTMRFPAKLFDAEGEKVKPFKAPTAGKHATKKELLKDAEREMTNVELKNAVNEAKASPEKPHLPKGRREELDQD